MRNSIAVDDTRILFVNSRPDYSRARLWLGISCVGATIVIAAFFLLIDLPNKLQQRKIKLLLFAAVGTVAVTWLSNCL